MINVNDFNACSHANCDCGFNISIGSKSHAVFQAIKDLLKKYGYEDHTDYSKKLGTKPEMLK